MKSKIIQLLLCITGIASVFCLSNCKKLVDIPPPVNTITTSQVFSTDKEATSAMSGVYWGMINGNGYGVFKDATTIYGGVSADEFEFFEQSFVANIAFQNNSILSNNNFVSSYFWEPIYFTIYGCNAVIAGVKSSPSISDSVRNELIGEAECVRALSNFYLINLFGAAPLVLTTNYNNTSLLQRSPVDTINSSIIADLKDAQSRLAGDYSAGNGQRIIPNRWAATALLARVYLYTKDWADAASEASNVINNNSLYSLVSPLNNVFLINSNEAIWQLQQSNETGTFTATPEGASIIPLTPTSLPLLYLTPALLNAFENNDNRRLLWVDSTLYLGQYYYYPYKYQVGPSNEVASGTDAEYYMVLRLAEQYLIRAEAEANGVSGGTAAAIIDLNFIRNRAGLPNLSPALTGDSLIAAIAQERRIELFAEWGNRWFDLKRWGNATQVLSTDKGITVKSNSLLWPIPFSELATDPNLTQNPGY